MCSRAQSALSCTACITVVTHDPNMTLNLRGHEMVFLVSKITLSSLVSAVQRSNMLQPAVHHCCILSVRAQLLCKALCQTLA